MAKCMSCGKRALFTASFGNVTLCKKCAALVDVKGWRSREFANFEELVSKKKEVVNKAVDGNISESIVEEIGRYFDEYIDLGYITCIDGKAGQKLKLFANYCIITTKNELKKAELEKLFTQFDPLECDYDDDDDDQIFTTSDKMTIAKGLLSGKVLSTGVNAAVTAALNQEEKEREAERKHRAQEKQEEEQMKRIGRLINSGERRVDLRRLSDVEIFSRWNTTLGYLKFVKKGSDPNAIYDCDYFFFNNAIPFKSRKIKKNVGTIRGLIIDRIVEIDRELRAMDVSKKKKKENGLVEKVEPTDEIRKYKQLFDEGIITEDEFNAKKKKLMEL